MVVPPTRRIRFGFQLGSEHESDPVGVAQRAEQLGFDTVLLSDHVGPGISPMVALAAMAQGTTRIRVGTYTLNNDMRNPVQLAWEAATIDHLSGGRLEVGLGAGTRAGVCVHLRVSVDEIAAQIIGHRDRWGITYFGVRSLDAFAPVLAAVRSLE